MGSATSVMVANAFHEDIWVNVDSVLIEESSSSKQCSAHAAIGVPLPALLPEIQVKAEAGFNEAKSEKIVFNKYVDIGYTKMSRGNVTTFKPAQNATSEDMKVVYVSIGYYDTDGNEQYITRNHPHEVKHSVIVTESGSIVDSKGKEEPWVDLNGKHHFCQDCLEEGSTCSICLVENSLTTIEKSLNVVQNNDIAHSLLTAVDIVSKKEIKDKEHQAVQVIREIKNLADNYKVLESKTKRCVRDVKDYGENLKESAEEFLEEGNISDFLQEMGETENIKSSIKEANDQHLVIQNQVKALKTRIVDHETSFNENAKAKKQFAKRMAIPGYAVIQNAEAVDNLTEKVIQSWDVGKKTKAVAQATSTATIGVVASAYVVNSVVTYPLMFPYLLIMAKLSSIAAKNYKELENRFKNIGQQMVSVEIHLSEIVKSIDEIESNLNNAMKAEKIFMKKKAGRVKKAEKLIERANSLLASCDRYFSQLDITKNKEASVEQSCRL